MYEARSRIVSNAATVQPERRIAKLRRLGIRISMAIACMCGLCLAAPCPWVPRYSFVLGVRYAQTTLIPALGRRSEVQIMQQIQYTRIVFSNIARGFRGRGNGQVAEATELIPALACTAKASSSIWRRGRQPNGYCSYRLFLAVSQTVTDLVSVWQEIRSSNAGDCHLHGCASR